MSRFVRAVRALLIGGTVVSSPLLVQRADAQVGHLPANSPYEDLKPTQDVTLLFGRFTSAPGLAGIFPKSSGFGGIRYDLPLAGPAFLTARYIFVPSERQFLLPTNSKKTRILGTTSTKLNEADVGFSIALTGRKTYHRLVPSISGGVGLASDFTKADTGGYSFGTKFSVNFGGNIRYVAHNGAGVRLEATKFIWQNRYPDSYLIPAVSDTTSVIKTSKERTSWMGHWGLSLGFFFPIFK
jgi:hypothetical protein